MKNPSVATMRYVLRITAFLLLSLIMAERAHSSQIAEREVLPNGMVLLRAERKALPIVKIVIAIKAGSVNEPADKAGLANLTADMLNEGTLRRSSRQISEEIEFVGGALGSSGGSDYMTVTLSVLKKDIDLGFDLMSDIILNPSFKDEEINRRKTIIKNSIIQQKEEPGAVAGKAFAKAVFGEHPYGWPVEGTEESIDKISRQDIVEFHKTYYAPNNAIMSVVGDIGKEELKSLIDRYMGKWEKKGTPALNLPVPEADKGPQVIKINKDLTQATIILGHLGITRDNPDFYAVSVMNYILGGGGFSSRLVDNIRDNKGLAYDVHSYFSAQKYSGSFVAGLQTKNVSANEAIGEVLKEIERIRTEQVSEKELNDAKSYLTGSFPLRVDTNNKIAGFLISIEFYGLGLDYIDRYKGYIDSVTREDVLRVAKKYLHPDDYVLVVVGDLTKANLKY